MSLVRKTDIVRDHMASGDHRAALSIAKDFTRLAKADKVAIVRAHEALVHPGFYVQLKRDPAAMVSAGVSVLSRLYGTAA